MCGILGFSWNDPSLLKKLTRLLKHRGPDAEGFYTDDIVSLGHRRLSILDLSKNGQQPMPNEDSTIWITYNGEIFNFETIRNALIKKGHHFISKTDTEVLIHGYEEWGHSLLKRLNGQFAFCIYDKKRKELFLARDRMGINPLYYYFDTKKFIFGSELKVILKSGVRLTLNTFAKDYYFLFGHCPRRESIIENTYKIEPGYYLVFDLQKCSIRDYKPYWSPTFSATITSEKDALVSLKRLFEDAVQLRLVADVPVGAFLSGGVDSSAVVAYASKYKKNLNTFSIKFEYDEFDESKYAALVSKTFSTTHHTITFTANEICQLLPKLIYHYDEPFADPSMIPTFLVSSVARRNVTVSLSGDGGDELFGGYHTYSYYHLLTFSTYYPKFFNTLFSTLFSFFPSNQYLTTYFSLASQQKKYAPLMSFLLPSQARRFLSKDPMLYYKTYEAFFHPHWLHHAIYHDFKNYLPCDILTKVDRASMANSLESRPPLLDHRFVEFACSLHPSLKIRGYKKGKYIFKKAFEGILPSIILTRKKQGFSVPLRYYLKKELKSYVDNLYDNTFLKQYGFSKSLLDSNKTNIRLLWALIIFKEWSKVW
ncbi:MAG: asparagine synthase (glutamine-hydrolyzing), partial [Candidatus Woesearchaeota archaeon]